MDFDDLIYLAHEADGLVQGDDDAVVVGDVKAGRGRAYFARGPRLIIWPSWDRMPSLRNLLMAELAL